MMPKARLGGGLAPDQLSGGAGGSAEREAGIKPKRPRHIGAQSARPPSVLVPAAAALMHRGDGGMSLGSAPSDHLYQYRPRVTPAPCRRPSHPHPHPNPHPQPHPHPNRNPEVVVSHDHDFMTTVCTDILHCWQRKLMPYQANPNPTVTLTEP